MDDPATTRPRLRLVGGAPRGTDRPSTEGGEGGEGAATTAGAGRGDGVERSLGSYDARLPFSDASANLARKELVAQLAPLDVGRRVVEDASVVLHELVRNGIDHGRPCDDHTLEVSWQVTATSLTLHVTDCGSADDACTPACAHTPAHDPRSAEDRSECSSERWRHKLLTPAPPDAVRGRGLHLVDALSSSWDVTGSARGTTVTASLDLD